MSMETIYEVIRRNSILTSLEKRVFIEKSISEHFGKMEGIPSISTSVKLNPNCKRNQACGGKKCLECLRCYNKSDRTKLIREKLK